MKRERPSNCSEGISSSHLAPLLAGIDEAATALRLGRTKVYALMLEGVLPFVKIGRRRLIPVSELKALVERLQIGGEI